MGRILRFTLVAAGLAAVAACTVHQASTPTLTGPSEFATSINLYATPDAITQDGVSKSTLQVVLRDAYGKPPATTQTVQLQVISNGKPVDYGTLSARTVYTAADGTASAVYTAPPAPLPSIGTSVAACHGLAGPCVTIVAATVGSNYVTSNQSSVDIRLVPPPQAPVDPSMPQALFSPSNWSPAVNDVVSFNASSSTAGIGHTLVGYSWNFGDGTTKTGSSTTHDFSPAGTYVVMLTVTNEIGQTSTISGALTVH